MRDNGLQAATCMGSPRGPRNHDGTIIQGAIDTMWGTDMTATVTVEHGRVAVFIAVDHGSAACVGIHAAVCGARHEALEPKFVFVQLHERADTQTAKAFLKALVAAVSYHIRVDRRGKRTPSEG